MIFRNYSYVPARNIAKVLGTIGAVIEAEARKAGLGKFRYNPDWLKKGFVTIIRENRDILTKEQLLILTDFSEKEFDALLKDYDFLDVARRQTERYRARIRRSAGGRTSNGKGQENSGRILRRTDGKAV